MVLLFVFAFAPLAFSNMPYPYPLQQMIADQLLPIFIFYALTGVIESGIAYYFLSKKDWKLAKLVFIINLVSWPVIWFGINPILRSIEYDSTVISILLCEVIAILGESAAIFYFMKKKLPYIQAIKYSFIMNISSALVGIAFLLLYIPIFRDFARWSVSWLER